MKRMKQFFSMFLVMFLVLSVISPNAASASKVRPSLKAVTTQVTSPIYQSKSTHSKKVATVKKGATVSIVSEAKGWSYVTYGSKKGYMVSKSFTPKQNEMATKKSVSLYSSTSSKSHKIKTLFPDIEVLVLKEYRSWALVQFGGTSGWMAKSHLKSRVKKPVIKAATVQTDVSIIYVSPSTSAKEVSTLKFGDSVVILSEAEGWSHIRFGQVTGYMISKDFTPEETEFATTHSSIVYYDTSSKSEKVMTIPANAIVTVLKVYRSWSLVQYESQVGWMATRYLVLQDTNPEPDPIEDEPTPPTVPEEPTVPEDPNAEFKQLVKASYEKVSQSNDWQEQSVEVLRLVNLYRVENGLKPLVEKQNLLEFALFRWDDMKTNDYISHDSPIYGSFYEMGGKVGIGIDRLSTENIAWNQMTPNQVFEVWKYSLYHNATMLEPNYTHTGIIWKDGLAVQVFEEDL
ncbi:SH3 domain-containing protein [Exiguobacterium sp. s162]|uniref:SH3 domain-containing protein n=1 Tax=Exiguobacterium sp. s162 TaxID=2751276 RepID=UPI001BE92B92|nr:SH3 domain-containing protein [Exiguobacterium sp. s162]